MDLLLNNLQRLICHNTQPTNETRTNNYIRNQYLVTVKKKFETHIPDDEYENYVAIHIEAPTGSIPTKSRTKCRILWEAIKEKKNKIICKKKTQPRNLSKPWEN